MRDVKTNNQQGCPQRESNNARSRMVSFQPSSVANVFFSDANLGALHQAIRYRVWVDSDRKLVIGRQSEDQLVFVMRSVFLTDSYNREGNQAVILEQVRDLNQLVLNFCVPQIIKEANMYRQYVHDSSTLPIPLEHMKLVSKKGENQLQFNNSF
jgi:hypothetical protein